MPAWHSNPLIWREWRMASRPGRFWGTLLVVFGLLGIVFANLVLNEHYRTLGHVRPGLDWQRVYVVFTAVVLGVQIFIAFYVAMASAMNSVVKEKQSKTHEFLLSLPLGPSRQVIGLAVGPNLLGLLLLVLLTPVSLIFGLAGSVDLTNLLWLYVLMAAGFAAVSALGVAGSNGLGASRAAWLVVLFVLAAGYSLLDFVDSSDFKSLPLLTVSPYALLWASVREPDRIAGIFSPGRYHFYSMTVPWQVCPLTFYVFLAVVGFAAARRRFTRPTGRALNRWAVVAAYAVFQVLFIGFMADRFGAWSFGDVGHASGYLMGFFILILVWSVFATADYAHLMQWVEKRRAWPGRLLTESFTDHRTPPLLPAAVLWAITVAGALTISALYWWTSPSWGIQVSPDGIISRDGQFAAVSWTVRLVLVGAILLAFLMAYVAAFLLGCTLSRRAGGMIGALFLALAIAVPVSFAGLGRMDEAMNLTPFGLLMKGNLLSCEVTDAVVMTSAAWTSLWGAIALLAVFGGLCAWRFGEMLRIAPLARRRARAEAAA